MKEWFASIQFGFFVAVTRGKGWCHLVCTGAGDFRRRDSNPAFKLKEYRRPSLRTLLYTVFPYLNYGGLDEAGSGQAVSLSAAVRTRSVHHLPRFEPLPVVKLFMNSRKSICPI